MKFDSEKWALSFYGVIDERFEVETDMFQLHIHRNNRINKLSTRRGDGTLDIFIPQSWKMDRYKNQEQLRLSQLKYYPNFPSYSPTDCGLTAEKVGIII